MSTTFTTVTDNYHPGADWPEGTHEIVTRVDGTLADQVRARSDRDGIVLIVENGAEGGFSEFTVEWDWDFKVTVDDATVWTEDGVYGATDFTRDRDRRSALTRFIAWAEATQ